MHFPNPGDDVTVKLGGQCGLSLTGQVIRMVMEGQRQGFEMRNRHGQEVVLFYEELDDLVVRPAPPPPTPQA